MQFVLYVVAGVLGGVLGGMGMGGGTLLIPLLGIFYGVNQHTAQAVNLVSFMPMAIIALIIHAKNKLINYNCVLAIVLPGVATCIAGCYLARATSGDVLSRCFGGFLILLAVLQLVLGLKKESKNDKK